VTASARTRRESATEQSDRTLHLTGAMRNARCARILLDALQVSSGVYTAHTLSCASSPPCILRLAPMARRVAFVASHPIMIHPDPIEPDTLSAPHWYVGVLVFRARVGDAWQDDYLLDHQVRLVRAGDPDAGYSRAMDIGRQEEHSYPNSDGDTVSWQFVGLADLDDVDSPGDGVEIYSWRTRGEPADVVLPKDQLAVFRRASQANKTAGEILGE
jgi:hypothetical protein